MTEQDYITNDIEDLKIFGEIQIFKLKDRISDPKEFIEKNYEDLESIGFENFKICLQIVPKTFSFQKTKKSDTILIAFKNETAKFMFNLILRK